MATHRIITPMSMNIEGLNTKLIHSEAESGMRTDKHPVIAG